VFPTGDSEHQICVGYFFGIYDLTGFAFDAVRTIPACLCYGQLIDFCQGRQDYVVLVICARILIGTVGIFAEVYLF
jgi:hypothetical protein